MAEIGGNASQFEPVDDLAEADRLMREGPSSMASAQIWTKGQGGAIKTQLIMLNDAERALYAMIPPDVDPLAFKADVDGSGSKECFFSVSLARANIFFKGEFLGIDPLGLKFRLPARIYKVQRRQQMRCIIPYHYVIKAGFLDPITGEATTRKVIDISSGGLAFATPEIEGAMFPVGLELKPVTLSVNNRKISVDAVVRHSRPIPPGQKYQGVKIGLEFAGIAGPDKDAIEAYVFEENRKTFGKIVFGAP